MILLHLLVAPYSKVEESFNLQATHDILLYGTPTNNVAEKLQAYDHFAFPGAVPRTFVGSFILAGLSKPLIAFLGWQYAQFSVRAVLGLFNAFALVFYSQCLSKAYGRGVGRWFLAFLAAQFHIVFYASRTLPNSFALGMTTIALGNFLPSPATSPSEDKTVRRQHTGIYLLVAAGIIFRAEIALLLAAQVIISYFDNALSLHTIITAGIPAALAALAISVPIDTYFWQAGKPIWPELSSVLFNVYEGKSSEWGTSPWYTYFFEYAPKLILNPIAFALNVFANFYAPLEIQYRQINLAAWSYVGMYSLLAHKEARFIIYAVPPMTGAAALAANWIWTRRSKAIYYKAASTLALLSIPISFLGATAMLLISSLNYPGGQALYALHQHLAETNATGLVRVHMDVLACMTGITRFQQDVPTPPAWSLAPPLLEQNIEFEYDKTEDEETLLTPDFWAHFDYVLAEDPKLVIGSWDTVQEIPGYAGLEILKPTDPLAQDVDDAEVAAAIKKKWRQLVWWYFQGSSGAPEGKGSLVPDLVAELGYYGLLREAVRRFVTRGYWVGIKMEPKIRILKRQMPSEPIVADVPE